MIDERELRIGSWVQDKDGNQYPIENGWQIDEGLELFPVPLTEEWLRSFGFKTTDRENDYVLNGFRVTHVHLTGNFCYALGNGNNPPAMKFVHELQNLYRAVTKKEPEHKSMIANG